SAVGVGALVEVVELRQEGLLPLLGLVLEALLERLLVEASSPVTTAVLMALTLLVGASLATAGLLGAIGDEVVQIAAVVAPGVLPLPIVVDALELADEEAQVVVAQRLQLLICYRRQGGKRKAKSRVSIRARSTWTSHKSDALGRRGTIELGSCMVIHLCGLELAEKLVHRQSLIASRLNDRVHLEIPHRAVKCVEQLEGLLVLYVLKGISRSVRIDFVHNRLKPTEHIANALTRPLCEVLVFMPVSLEQSGLHLRCALVVVLEARPNFVGFLKTLDA